ncbi:MAG: carboxylating nicotinate-nucleotide diphosphorylase, partial [Thermomicrobiales bacterium]
ALQEDIGTGDITTLATVPADRTATAELLIKQNGVLSGMDVTEYIFQRVDPSLACSGFEAGGTAVSSGDLVGRIQGSARSLLTAERTALNFLQRLSGIATLTADYVAVVQGTSAHVVDTRKTGPGLRLLEKRAVIDGGGRNHRFGLSDGVLIKDNHLEAVGGDQRVTRAIGQARRTAPHTLKIEVEVGNLAELEEALNAGADIVMLDNMSTTDMATAVEVRQRLGSIALLEASGNVTLLRLREIAETGVDLISVGALTHSAPALDISLNLKLV